MSAHREQTLRMRAYLLMTLLALGTALSACGGDVAGAGDDPRQPSSNADAAVPGAGTLRDEDAPGTAAPRTGQEPDAGTGQQPRGPLTELRGTADSDPQMYGTMTEAHGDGSAEPLLLHAPSLPERWRLVDPDGPHFVRSVCGVQLDPVKPRDAAQRRWGQVEEFVYLESEVHVFAEAEAHGLVHRVADALPGCRGYGVLGDGREVPYGEGDVNVVVEAWRPDGEAGGLKDWVFLTETTEETGQVRHVALRDLDDGWHWVSLATTVQPQLDRAVLVDAVAQAGA